MKIAVPYDNEQVFGHFGQTKTFAIYEVNEQKQIVDKKLLPTQEQGHGALPVLLKAHGVDILLAGGMGQGAKDAIAKQGIIGLTGATGSVDEVVKAYLAGKFVSTNTVCQHHHDHGEGHTCGSCSH
ncbi:MAG: NifB/NifX family molybdenum-iron cluster-binding protein [Clostridia bacterium]|nr:NifB/NifX family molybdenum-iron cluster-binding protein [Clostridia bacterium]